ncbi:MAG: hypothetical protein AAGG51_30460 [Cyanobacteria bacterium P01_G01_bin.54]
MAKRDYNAIAPLPSVMVFPRIPQHLVRPLKRQKTLAQLCFWTSGAIGFMGGLVGLAGAVSQNPIVIILGFSLFAPSVLCSLLADWASRELSRRLTTAQKEQLTLDLQLQSTWQAGYESGYGAAQGEPFGSGMPTAPENPQQAQAIAQLQAQITTIQAQMQQAATHYQQEIAARERTIAELQAQLTRTVNERARLYALQGQHLSAGQLQSESAHLNPARQDVSRLEMVMLEQQLAERDRQIQSLQAKLEQLSQAQQAALQAEHRQGYDQGVNQTREQYALQLEKLTMLNTKLQVQLQQRAQWPTLARSPDAMTASQQLNIDSVLIGTAPPEKPNADDPEVTECPHCQTVARHAIQARNKKTGAVSRWKCKNRDCRKTFKAS